MEGELNLLALNALKIKGTKKKMIYWPESIKQDCVRLLNAGMSVEKISASLGITIKTLKKWQSSRAVIFKEIKADVLNSDSEESKSFTLTFSSGPRIENLSFEDLKFFKACGLI